MTSEDLIPVTVLTGFLGSGKTTILSRLLGDPSWADTAVIVNEFGEVGLDHALMESSEENIIDLSCGCVCCTLRGDLTETLLDLWERRTAGTIQPFRRVVLETTGLADPAPIIHTLMQEPLVFAHYRLARVVTAVDAVNAAATLAAQPEAVKQVAVADTILLTKTDIANDASAVEALTARLEGLGPTADIEFCTQGETTPETLFAGGLYDPAAKGADVAAWLAHEAGARHGHAHDVNRHGDDIVAFAIERDEPIGRGALSSFLQMLADQRGDDLLRLKGLVALTDDPARPAVVHGVQHVIHPITRLDAWPDGLNGTAIVLIVRGIERDWVEALFDRVTESAYAGLAR
jgi:G3E family GTPase